MAQELKVNIGVKTEGADEAIKSLDSIVKEINAVDEALKNVQKDTVAYDELNKKSQALKKELEGVAEAINKQSPEPIKAISGATNTWSSAVSDLAGKIPGLAAAQKALNLVMSLNPIGLLVTALGALAGILSQNKEVMDKISFAFAAFNKVIRVIGDDIVAFGKRFVDALSNPKQALLDLGEFIQNNLINRVKGLGQIVEALANRDLKALGTALVQVGTGFDAQQQKAIADYATHLGDVAVEGFKAAEALDGLADTQAKLLPAMARTNGEIEKQKTLLADRTKTDQERIAAAEKIIELETLQAQRRAKIAQDELEAERLKTKGVELGGEERLALAQKEAAAIDAVNGVEAATRRAQVQLEVLKQSIIDDAAAKQKAADEAAKKKAEEDQKKVEKERETQAKLQQVLIDAENARRIALATIAVDQADTPEAKIQAQKDLAAVELQIQQETLQQKRDAEIADLQLRLGATQQFFDAKKAIEESYNLQKQQLDADANAKEIENAKKTASEQQEINNQKRDGAFAAAAAGINAIQSLTNLVFQQQRAKVKQGSKEDLEIQKKQFKTNKALQLVNAGIQTAQAVIAAYSSGAAVPIAGVALGPIMAAIAGAAGAVQIGFIAAKQFNPEGGSSSLPPALPSQSAALGSGAEIAANNVAGKASGFAADANAIINGKRPPTGSNLNPVKVYVTETDITNTQNKVSVIEQKATYP